MPTLQLNTAVRRKNFACEKNLGNQLGGTNTEALSNAADSNTNLVKSIQEWRGNGNNDVRLKVVLEDPNNAQEYFATSSIIQCVGYHSCSHIILLLYLHESWSAV